MDEIFKALADPTRRQMLDQLFKQDGQTLLALSRQLTMTRFGAMKHLKVLEEAGLITTRRKGREKFHFLNAVPIRLVYERWVSKYAEPWTVMLSNMKTTIEEAMMEKVYEIYIKTTPQRLWDAITRTDVRKIYSFGVRVDSDWTKGSNYKGEGGPEEAPIPLLEGENLEVDPPRRLVQSYRALWSDAVKAQGTSRVTWEIQQVADSCKLTVTHDELRADANPELFGGWPMILSGLKTLLETGEFLTTPASLQYLNPPPPEFLKTHRL